MNQAEGCGPPQRKRSVWYTLACQLEPGDTLHFLPYCPQRISESLFRQATCQRLVRHCCTNSSASSSKSGIRRRYRC